MSEPKSFASLSPSLLARKGSARPAMRPQLLPIHMFHEATARQLEEDLGWNDMGHDHSEASHDNAEASSAATTQPEAEVIALKDGMEVAQSHVPEVIRQQAQVSNSVSRAGKQRKSALTAGGRAAFTLRLDAERHLKLRLACTVNGRSAQQIVTEALDRLIADMPEIAALSAQVKKRS